MDDRANDAPARMLGLDVGERRIGVAVNEGRMAVPLTIIEHTHRAADIARILSLAETERATAIVVGLPLSMSGDDSEQTRLTRKFAADLEASTKLPLIWQDERLSSASVRLERPPTKPTRRTPKPRVDDLAAAVILQSYIDAMGPAS